MDPAAAIRWYAGIGSRKTPDDMMRTMQRLARALAEAGYGLRSGAADGADQAFEAGVGTGPKQIFVPWPGFSERACALRAVTRGSDFNALRGIIPLSALPHAPEARDIASGFHPGWARLSSPVRKLMARNVMQCLGPDLASPSAFVACWAQQPKFDANGHVIDVHGGTGLAVRLAAHYGIPVFHLGVPLHARRIERFLAAA